MAAYATARVRARIFWRRGAILAGTRAIPFLDRARRTCAVRRIAGGGHATHTRAMDLAASVAPVSIKHVVPNLRSARAPPGRTLFRVQISTPPPRGLRARATPRVPGGAPRVRGAVSRPRVRAIAARRCGWPRRRNALSMHFPETFCRDICRSNNFSAALCKTVR